MSEKDSIFNSKFHKFSSICGLKIKSSKIPISLKPENFDFTSQPKSLPIPIEKSKKFDSSDSLLSISSSRSYDSLKNLINSEFKDETHLKVPTKRRIRDSQIEISKSPQIKDVLKLLSLSPDLKLVHDFKKI